MERLYSSPRLACLLRLFLLALAGCSITLSLAPFGYWPLAIVALMVLLHQLNDASPRQAIQRCLVFSAAMFLSGSYWVFVSMNTYGGASPPLAIIMTLAFCLFLAALVPPFAWAYVRFFRSSSSLCNALAFASLWLMSEWLRIWLLTGFPWLFIGYSQTQAQLSSWAPIIGTLGISWLLAFTAGLLLMLASALLRYQSHNESFLSGANLSTIGLLMAIWLAPAALDDIQWTQRKSDSPYTVALIQPNIDLKHKWDRRFLFQDMDFHRQASRENADADIIIWPETAVARMYHKAHFFLAQVDAEAQRTDTAIILGIPSAWNKDGEPEKVYHNSMLAIGKASGIYHKQKLVPFGEYLPLEAQLRGLIEFFDLPMSQFRPGPSGQAPFDAKGLKIMPYICYEIVYPDFVAATAAAADILLTVSNDAWFGDSIGPLQHLQMAQMRALETGRNLIRGTNNGITAIIDFNGNIQSQLPQFQRGVLKGKVYARQGLTPVTRFGTLPPLLFSILLLLIITLHHRQLLRLRR